MLFYREIDKLANTISNIKILAEELITDEEFLYTEYDLFLNLKGENENEW